MEGGRAYALLEESSASGEFESEEIDSFELDAERAACLRAYRKLKARMPGRQFRSTWRALSREGSPAFGATLSPPSARAPRPWVSPGSSRLYCERLQVRSQRDSN